MALVYHGKLSALFGRHRECISCQRYIITHYKIILVNLISINLQTPKLFWNHGQMQINNIPFNITESKKLECQFGPHYCKEMPQKSTRVRLQGSLKIGCHAHIVIKQCTLYPQYKIYDEELKQFTMRTLREKKMNLLKGELFWSHEDKNNVLHFPTYWIRSQWSPYWKRSSWIFSKMTK